MGNFQRQEKKAEMKTRAINGKASAPTGLERRVWGRAVRFHFLGFGS